ncbi:FN3 associated domain-containing protein, partial [Balneolaceae bacterium ANBcel3]|nr:FN3 associated domain-containing protein [Balneolaceae bacterium ANBcel3]
MKTVFFLISCFRFRNPVFAVPLLFLLGLAPLSDHASLHAQNQELPALYINEFLASNGSGIEDEDGDTGPWIELFNAGDTPIDLSWHALSDDYNRPWRWIFPNVTIEPGEFLLVFASGKDRRVPGEPLHTNFRISSAGEELLITDIQGNRIDEVPPTPLQTDVSYGRFPDGSDQWFFFSTPTPGEPNYHQAFEEITYPPVFSVSGGFYYDEFFLELKAPESAVIYYTLDGSEPDSTSHVYTGPIKITDRSHLPNNLSTIQTSPEGKILTTGFEWVMPEERVFKGNVVRARAMIPGQKPSKIITHSYYVDPEGPGRYPLPVLSLVTDSLHLFDYETGIYIPGKIYDEQDGDDHQVANYFQRGDEWERPASVEFFDEQGARFHSQDIGIRIHGWGSRVLSQKSLRLYARNEYGDSRFNVQIFPDLPYRSYNRLLLRNSGQDFFARSTMFRDAFLQTL